MDTKIDDFILVCYAIRKKIGLQSLFFTVDPCFEPSRLFFKSRKMDFFKQENHMSSLGEEKPK